MSISRFTASRQRNVRASGLAIGFSLALAITAAAPVSAVDTEPSKDAPDLTAVRAKIKAREFATARDELFKLADKHQHADVYNLLGFSLRKSGDHQRAATFYSKALDFDPNHKGALEYQGEMFVELGQMEKAKANLAKLEKLCPAGCEEREDLEKAIATKAESPGKVK